MLRLWLLSLECWLWSLDHFLQPSAKFFLFLNRNGYQLSLACWYCPCLRGTIFCLDRKEIKKRMISILEVSKQANLLIYVGWGWFVLLGKVFWSISHVLFFKETINQKRDKWKRWMTIIPKSKTWRYCSCWRRWDCESSFICSRS